MKPAGLDHYEYAPLAPISDLTAMRKEFDRCWPWLWDSLCEFGPTHNKEHVWQRISSRRAFLWPGDSCAIVGEIIVWPIGLRDFHYWLQGGKLEECLEMHPGIEQWAIETFKCQRATGDGREGWIVKMHGNWEKGSRKRFKWLSGVEVISNWTNGSRET